MSLGERGQRARADRAEMRCAHYTCTHLHVRASAQGLLTFVSITRDLKIDLNIGQERFNTLWPSSGYGMFWCVYRGFYHVRQVPGCTLALAAPAERCSRCIVRHRCIVRGSLGWTTPAEIR